jgi:hypothetical protein
MPHVAGVANVTGILYHVSMTIDYTDFFEVLLLVLL